MKKTILLLLLLAFVFSSNLIAQTTRYVDNASVGGANNGTSWDDAFLKLEDAIAAANDGDTIFVAKGTYFTPIGGTFNMKEGVKIFGSFQGGETSLSQRVFGFQASDSSILSGQYLSRVIENIDNGLTTAAVLDGFILTDGSAFQGGAMYNKNVTPTFNNLIIKNSRSNGPYSGGGIYNENASITLTNSIITADTAGVYGGGVYNLNSSPVFNNVQIINNISHNDGGGMYNDNSFNNLNPQLTNVIFKNNTCGLPNNNGGGMYNYNSSPVLQNVDFIANTAGFGGGMYNNGANFNISPTLTDVSFKGNSAGQGGGGMYNYVGSYPTLTNTLFSGNSADQGGGVYSYSASATYTNVTFAGNNAATDGGAMHNDFGCTTTITNCIISGNSSSVYTYPDPDFSNTNFSYTLIEGGIGIGVGNDNGNNLVSDPTDPLYANPVAYTLAPTSAGDYTLKTGSYAINAGNNAANTTTLDLAGKPRIVDNTIDMGAYELPVIRYDASGTTFVKEGGAGNLTGDNWANAAPQLGEALHAAASDPSIQQIWVAGGTYKPVYVINDSLTREQDKSFVLVNNVKVYGGFAGTESLLADRDLSLTANKSILSGDFANNDAVDIINNGEASLFTLEDNAFHVVVSAGDVGTAVLDGFSIISGSALDLTQGTSGNLTDLIDSTTVNGKRVINFFGGALYSASSSPALTNLKIAGNFGYLGGGIFNDSSNNIISNTVISGNLSLIGGGIGNNASSPYLTNVTLAGNFSLSSGAFGMYNANGSAPQIRNSIIYELGPAILNVDDAQPVFYNSLIGGSGGSAGWDNSVGIDGGNNLDADPQFTAPLIFVPFSTGGDYSIQGNSPAINAGNNTYYSADSIPNLSGITKDIKGSPRILNFIVDMGAYETMTVLPVTIVNFTGNALSNNTAQLNWKTTSEINTSYFDIQRSADAKTFTTIGTTGAVGSGSNSYNYNDGTPLQSGYYRLRIVDKNGTAKYTNIVYISFNAFASSITVFPNPATSFVTVVTNNKTLAGSTAILYNLNGQTLQKVQLGNSSTVVPVIGLASGTYLLKVQTGETFKVIVK
ncbi:beta strand repeat-containing protein [Ferruginibacter albus]|uniref:beta strand repeat-containing protein n=1 Tax=Ferruginibacter albus TaxID=2875540 RepID=UPI001CC63AE5|nr:T9SS type A sorting domain-containing protein [Ferruginibacter albus]UAY53161.1 T9SS type A sorting domain-containing protein [Ferruginibacter albus]